MVLLAIYRLICPPDYEKCSMRVKYRSFSDALRLHDWDWSKAQPTSPSEKDDKKSVLRGNWIDIAFRIFILMHYPHYFIDAIVKLTKCYYHGVDPCKTVFLSHHIWTVILSRSFFMMDHYPWFIILPIGFHAIICAFPNVIPYNEVAYGLMQLNM